VLGDVGSAYASVMPQAKERASFFPAIEKKHGQPMSYWFGVMDEIKDRTYDEQMAYLQENHGFSRAHGNALIMYTKGSVSAQRVGTVDEYLADFDETRQATVRAVIKAIQRKFPRAEVLIAWNHPMVRVDGAYVFGISVATNHLTLAPFDGEVLDEFRPRLDGYVVKKKTFQVPADWQVDASLIQDMVAANVNKLNQQRES
jgi:uncharacterized protein YdhG (YjbR/CyaY superfamily)